MGEKKASRFGFYLGLTELADEHRDIIVLDADLPKTTGSEAFRKAHPERFLNVGISEQNMVGMCAGLSRVGYVPFCGSMAVFAAGRAFEIIRNSVAYPSLNVKIVGSHGGITAAGDGGTHQCIEDLALMRAIPGMTVGKKDVGAQKVGKTDLLPGIVLTGVRPDIVGHIHGEK